MTDDEPILKKSNKRFTAFPIIYQDLWYFKKLQEDSIWKASEIDYVSDIQSWNSLGPDDQKFIENILAFFAGADGIVMENIDINFSSEVQIAEARIFYSLQNYIEGVHSETYALLLDTFVKDPIRKDHLFNAIDNIPCIQKKAKWCQKWMSNDKPFATRLVAFAFVEGIYFSGAFCSIFWLKNRKVCLNALCKSNEFISRDEQIHCNFAIALYKHLNKKITKTEFYKMLKEAVAIESEFITEALPCRLIGMNSNLMIQYIKFVSDHWTVKFGFPKLYNVDNPFPFMDLMALDSKTNFFEQRVTEYPKLDNSSLPTASNIQITEDF